MENEGDLRSRKCERNPFHHVPKCFHGTVAAEPLARGIAARSYLRFAPDGKALWGLYPSKDRRDVVRCISWPDQKDILNKADILSALVAKRASLTCLDVGRTWAVVGSADCTVKLIPTANPKGDW